MNYFFDTNFYRNLAKDVNLGLINFEELKDCEGKNNHTVLFSNPVAVELINHLSDNDKNKNICYDALKFMFHHTTPKIKDKKISRTIIPTFHHLFTKYFFKGKSNASDFNKSLFKVAHDLTSDKPLNHKSIQEFINEVQNFKLKEKKDIINEVQNFITNSLCKNGKIDWEILAKKENKYIKREFDNKIKNGGFHLDLAKSFFELAKTEIHLETDIKEIEFIEDFKHSLNFYVNNVISKIGTSNKLKNPHDKIWNNIYDLQLIIGLEYSLKNNHIQLVTDDTKINNEVNQQKELAINKEKYLKKLNLWSMKNEFYKYIEALQEKICKGLETVEGKAKFREDIWERPEGGGGRTRVIENGDVFEKGGVNISAVHGKLPEAMQKMFNVGEADFFACGLSLVIHPKNPMTPTVHANWRYFEMYDDNGEIINQWFGGGQDLTPYYLFEEDAIHFHQTCKTACDKHNQAFYSKFKKQCDDYFWNAHRNEARGIGGLFFDYCKATDQMSMKDWYNFVAEVGNSFLEAYVPIVEKRKNLPYTEAHRIWQEIRRGRYVEFNLVHDKGTLFGLKTNGRIESILMSLPPHVQWVYDHHPEKGSEEEKLIVLLSNPINWIEI